jgi:hypothetical protein
MATTSTAPTPAASVRRELGHRGGWVAFAALAASAATLLMWLTRDLTFFKDEWALLALRYDGGLPSLLREHNGHVFVAPTFVFKALWHTVGLEHHWPYQAALVTAHVGAVACVFALARRRVGDAVALAACAPLLVLGAAWQDLLWPASLNFELVILAFLLALLALERGDRAGEVVACAALLAAALSSSACVPLLLAAGLELWLRGRVGALWVPAVGLVAYAAWYAGYGDGGDVTLAHVLDTPPWAFTIGAATAGGLLGQRPDAGAVLFVGAVALLVVAVARRGATPRLVALAAALAGFWALSGAARATLEPSDVVRFVGPSAVLLVLLAAEAAAPLRLRTPRVAALAALVAIPAVIGSVSLLVGGRDALQGWSDTIRGGLGGLELQIDRAPEELYAAPETMLPIHAADYVRVTRLAGSSPAPSPGEILRLGPEGRVAADDVVRRLALQLAGADPSRLRGTGRCARHEGGATDLALSGGLTVVPGGAPVEVRLRRFAADFSAPPLAPVQPGTALTLRMAPDAAPLPWRVQLSAAQPFEACHA